ncbi:leukotriene A-4 hydrolase-like [Temnothorax nylanderi]|uniref:leukotriene A-4 hydrolase-like n=1 Tax=Temnothorax nylanderi TaxID=102681 RepID=UPI003A8AD806
MYMYSDKRYRYHLMRWLLLWVHYGQKKLNERISIFAEENTFQSTYVDNFRYTAIEDMLKTAESRYDICVLPPSIAHFEIECPCVTFISPTLLSGDLSCVVTLAQNISQSWAGNLVTCTNLWLNKSFSIFISRKIIRKIWHFEDMSTIVRKDELEDISMVETGRMLLDYLEDMLGGPSIFESFLKSLFLQFAHKSINVNDWADHVHNYFSYEKEMLDGMQLHKWFLDIRSPPNKNLHSPKMSAWETKSYDVAKKWVAWAVNRMDSTSHREVPDYPEGFCDAQKIKFLRYLDNCHMILDVVVLRAILHQYEFDSEHTMIEIRFAWLLLCIKIRLAEKVESALNFATEHCSPNYACPIFQHLYEWEEMREEAIETYNRNKGKMLNETQEKIGQILHQNL